MMAITFFRDSELIRKSHVVRTLFNLYETDEIASWNSDCNIKQAILSEKCFMPDSRLRNNSG